MTQFFDDLENTSANPGLFSSRKRSTFYTSTNKLHLVEVLRHSLYLYKYNVLYRYFLPRNSGSRSDTRKPVMKLITRPITNARTNWLKKTPMNIAAAEGPRPKYRNII